MMTAVKPSKNVMDKILKGEVKQIPSWHFVLKNIALWSIGITCVVAGAFTVSLIIFTFANSSLFIEGISHDYFWKKVTVAMPILWIFVTIIFVLLFKTFIRRTNGGYKYSIIIILLVNILLSLVMGVILYMCGISYLIDDVLGDFRQYNSVEKRHGAMFHNPENGVIVGRVVGCTKEAYFTLISPTGEKWQVMNNHIEQQKKNEIKDGQVFMIVGKKIDNNIFVACDIKLRGMRGSNEAVIKKHRNNMRKYNGDKETMCDCGYISQDIELRVQKACDDIM